MQVVTTHINSSSAVEESDLLMANVEALANDNEDVKNTGPGDPYKCPDGKGRGKFCLSTNKHPCTETDC